MKKLKSFLYGIVMVTTTWGCLNFAKVGTEKFYYVPAILTLGIIAWEAYNIFFKDKDNEK